MHIGKISCTKKYPKSIEIIKEYASLEKVVEIVRELRDQDVLKKQLNLDLHTTNCRDNKVEAGRTILEAISSSSSSLTKDKHVKWTWMLHPHQVFLTEKGKKKDLGNKKPTKEEYRVYKDIRELHDENSKYIGKKREKCS